MVAVGRSDPVQRGANNFFIFLPVDGACIDPWGCAGLPAAGDNGGGIDPNGGQRAEVTPGEFPWQLSRIRGAAGAWPWQLTPDRPAANESPWQPGPGRVASDEFPRQLSPRS